MSVSEALPDGQMHQAQEVPESPFPAGRYRLSAAAAKELRELKRQYRTLPPRGLRYQTVPGAQFLLALREFRQVHRHPRRVVADALGISPQAVAQLELRSIPRKPAKWPSQEDIATLRALWRAAHGSGTPIRRTSTEYKRIHLTLVSLYDRDYAATEIAAALGVSPRQISRFEQPPISRRPPPANDDAD